MCKRVVSVLVGSEPVIAAWYRDGGGGLQIECGGVFCYC